ncbi:MAG TPA: diaminopimelate decarboxylase [Alphaproteobacteria bacterium]|nr:diaminopimelate decarboxylase [Alphaproteobacteria bacterium]
MSAFHYKNGVLHAEDVPLPEIAARHGTPAYVYSNAALTQRYRDFAAALSGLPVTICYALKANSNQAVIATFARLGAGADIVSAGELKRALAAGVPARKIVFAGVGKTEAEMALALDAGILQFNVESEPELRVLSRVAQARGRTASICLRVNPDVDAQTHAKITTGKSENKFGIEIARAPEIAELASRLPGIALEAVGLHIGSQLTSIAPFHAAFARLAELARSLTARGHALRRIDFGGGLGVSYGNGAGPDLAAYTEAVRDAVRGLDLDIILEPGRFLVADAGILLARVTYMKEGITKRFAIVDAAMNDLIRPTLYEAWMPIRLVTEPAHGAPLSAVDVVGPVCESGDYLALDRALPPLAAGDLIVVGGAGAYGAVMGSTYNSRPLAPEIMVNGAEAAVIRPRESIEALVAADRLPPWLELAKV